jgi:F-type H+-transporting ATPase subunit b
MKRVAISIACTLLWLLLAQAPSLGASPASPADQTSVSGEHAAERSVIPSHKEALIPAATTLIVFAFLLAVLGKFAWGPIASGLKSREDKIRKDIADAEASRRNAEATLKQYNDQLATAEGRIRDMLNKAQVDGEKLATNIRMQAQQEAEEAKERATRDIEASKNAAIREVHAQTADLATSIASKILRRNLNADDQRELVKQSLDQLQTIK